ncbi:WbqC family protein [Dysgonomonas sp. 511]|uniref:WbqC family protein n=1 Tax=Dysgonomonas sp. 511 TaxID=2302930 RepID=UPI0013D0CEFD|nr:WbqC family protein [Dysgonomonas sp. 511]NDV77680.1 hypothetical protein [Dysgonomonas sp. 511]
MDIYINSLYLAPIQYYTKILAANHIYMEQHESYIKQTYRNRCTILSANGPISLSIPVVYSSTEKTKMKDVRIAEHGNWQHMHWNAIVSAYNSTPFFEYYQDDFYPFYHQKYDFLLDFNEKLNELILSLLNTDTPAIEYTSHYEAQLKDGTADYREIIHPKKDWRELDKGFAPQPYYQVFAQKFGFTPNLSIIDLLFNMGNESLIVLLKSCN